MSRISRWIGIGLLGWALAPVAPALAQESYPSHPIQLVIPYPPGGPNDIIGRVLADELAATLKQTIVIKNQPGAGGNLATAAVARAAPDGYTLLLPGMAYAVNPSIFSNVSYSFDDYKTISMVVKGPLVLAVHPDLKVKSVAELLAAAKARPGEIAYASGGIGTSLHLAAELFKVEAGVDMLHVPYKGTGEAMSDLLSGRVPVMFSSPLAIRQHVDSGKLIALGTTGNTPLRGWENLPPIADAVPGYEMFAWYSLMAPAGTPDAIVKILNEATRKAQASASMQEKMTALGLDPTPTTPAEAQAYIDEEISKWARIVKDANIQAN